MPEGRIIARVAIAITTSELSNIAHKSEGVPVNYAEAMRWWKAAAALGDAAAIKKLDELHVQR